MPDVTWSEEHWLRLKLAVRAAWNLESNRISLQHFRRNYAPTDMVLGTLVGESAIGEYDEAIARFRNRESVAKRAVQIAMHGHPVEVYVRTPGNGLGLLSVGFYIGQLPRDIGEFWSEAGLNRASGFHVLKNGRAPRKQAGVKLGYDPRVTAIALERIAKPIIRNRGPYVRYYDRRIEHTLVTRPRMFLIAEKDGGRILDIGEPRTPGERGEYVETDELAHPDCPTCRLAVEKNAERRASRDFERERQSIGGDCRSFGGPHWQTGHRQSDAVRYMAKKIVRDLYRVARRNTPTSGTVTPQSETLRGVDVAGVG